MDGRVLLEEAMLEVVVGVVIEDLMMSINHYILASTVSMRNVHAVLAKAHTNESADSKNLRKGKGRGVLVGRVDASSLDTSILNWIGLISYLNHSSL